MGRSNRRQTSPCMIIADWRAVQTTLYFHRRPPPPSLDFIEDYSSRAVLSSHHVNHPGCTKTCTPYERQKPLSKVLVVNRLWNLFPAAVASLIFPSCSVFSPRVTLFLRTTASPSVPFARRDSYQLSIVSIILSFLSSLACCRSWLCSSKDIQGH